MTIATSSLPTQSRALAGYELTKEERAALLSVDAETLDAFAERLCVQLGKRGRPE